MNIINLIPYLLNKITKVENSVGNIDFSSLQAKSEKDQTNGYLGLNDIGRIESRFTNLPKVKYGSYWHFLNLAFNLTNGIIEGGTSSGAVYSANGVNAVKFKGGNLTAWSIPTIYIPALTNGYSFRKAYDSNIRITSNSTIQIESGLAVRLTAKQSNVTFALGNVSWSGGSFTGTGLIITHDPTINGGNLRIGKVVSNIFISINTSTAITNETLIKLRILYNKQIETAYFYVNHTLIYTLTNVNLDINTVYPITYSLGTTDATDTTIRAISILYLAQEIDIGE